MNRILKAIWNEFVYGGHLLSLGAVSIVYTSAVLLGIKITWDFMVIVYLGAYAPYIYNRYREFNKDFLTNPERTKHLEGQIKFAPAIIALSLSVMIGIFLYFDKISALVFAIFLVFLSFAYSILFKGLSKKIVGFKTFYVSLSWAFLVVLLVIYYSFSVTLAVFLLFVFIYLRLLLNTNFFDIKDIDTDKKDKLLTLPVIFAKDKLLPILNLINISAAIPIIFGVLLHVLPVYSLILLLSILYSFYYLDSAKKNMETGFLYYAIVDGEYVLWLFAIFFGKIIL